MRLVVQRLADARDYARRAAGYVDGIGLTAFTADTVRREAVCFCLMIVGEACVEAAKQLQKLPSDIPWAAIKGMRNVLVHEYWQIDDTIIYNTARDDAEPLATQLDGAIRQLGVAQ
jgi:uncharacterized protein with HEPN domain